jgi:hypothetical protein
LSAAASAEFSATAILNSEESNLAFNPSISACNSDIFDCASANCLLKSASLAKQAFN